MLYEIKFKNFAGIDDMGISLVAAKPKNRPAFSHKDEFVISSNNDIQALSFISIHGDNASGKQSFMSAVESMVELLSDNLSGSSIRSLLKENMGGEVSISFLDEEGKINEHKLKLLKTSKSQSIDIEHWLLKREANKDRDKESYLTLTILAVDDNYKLAETNPGKAALKSLFDKFEFVDLRYDAEEILNVVSTKRLICNNSHEEYLLTSEGGKNLLALNKKLSSAIEGGKILFIRDIDDRIHPRRLIKLIKGFAEANASAQVIGTMTSSTIIDYVRPDQIHVINMSRQNANASTHKMLRISDFMTGVRTDIEKLYLGGCFDGEPPN